MSDQTEDAFSSPELTDEQAALLAIKQASKVCLQSMASFASEGKIKEYFDAYHDLLVLWTPKEVLESEKLVQPWNIPSMDIQFIVLHTTNTLFTRVLNDSMVFQAATIARHNRNSSGLVTAHGAPIVSGS
jgi:hypothetical protein